MTELRIATERGGYRLMVSPNGMGERPHGPLWPTPKAAAAFFDTYRANHPQHCSPLREAEDHLARLSASPSGLTQPLRVEPDGSSHQESRLSAPALRPAAGPLGRTALGPPDIPR